MSDREKSNRFIDAVREVEYNARHGIAVGSDRPASPPETPGRVDHLAVMAATRDLLIAIGYDPAEIAASDTPRRVADFWLAFVQFEPPRLTGFPPCDPAQLITVVGIEAWSVCEHHLMPFRLRVSVGVLDAGRVLGLSKYARLVRAIASRPQLQERITDQIAEALARHCEAESVAVVVEGSHTCATMRGVRDPGIMKTTRMAGRFLSDPDRKNEFLRLVSAS